MTPGPEALQLIVTALGSGFGAGLAAWGALKSLRTEVAELRASLRTEVAELRALVTSVEARVVVAEATMDRRARAFEHRAKQDEKKGE